MVDAREQIKELLEEIVFSESFSVRTKFPNSVSDGLMITYFEIINNQTSLLVVDEIAFQIDVWAYDLETLIKLVHEVNSKLTSIGLKRQFTSPDQTPTETHSQYFRKTMRFGRKVDKRTNRLID